MTQPAIIEALCRLLPLAHCSSLMPVVVIIIAIIIIIKGTIVIFIVLPATLPENPHKRLMWGLPVCLHVSVLSDLLVCLEK